MAYPIVRANSTTSRVVSSSLRGSGYLRYIATGAKKRGVLGRLLVGCAVLLVLLLCARLSVSRYGDRVIAAGIALPLLVTAIRHPVISLAMLVVVIASFFEYSSLPRTGLPGNPPINIADILLAASLGGVLWKTGWHSLPYIVRRYALAMLFLLALAAVATVKTYMLGAEQAREALYCYRNLLYLGIAIAVALIFTRANWRRLTDGAIFYAAVISAISLAAALSPAVGRIVTDLSPHSLTTSAETFSTRATPRVRLLGLFFVYAMVLPTLVSAWVIRDRLSGLRLLAVALMIGAIGVSLNRDMYGGALVGLVVALLLGGPKLRKSLGVALLVVFGVVAITALTSLGSGIVGRFGARAATLFTPTQLLE